MNRLVIAVDCDDVLVSTTPFFVDLYNRTYGTQGTLAQSHDSNPDIWQASEQLQDERWFAMTKHDEYKSLAPSPEVVETLGRLSLDHELHLVTARKEEERQFTQDMLDSHLSGIFQSMEFVGWSGSKGDICGSLRADVLLDDSFRHLVSAYECGVKNLLWFGDYPWQVEDGGGMPVTRCRNWSDVEVEIERIAKN